MRVVAQDFAQMAARPARDTSGNGELVEAVLADGRSDMILTFSRTGWSNPAGVPRPAEQRVRYRFIDESLIREHWVSVDPALATEPRQRVLLTKVKSIEVRFLDPASRQWSTEWPPAGSTATITPATVDLLLVRPLAIEFTVVFEDWGRIHRLFEIPT
jgi:general secretion pathway protein J